MEQQLSLLEVPATPEATPVWNALDEQERAAVAVDAENRLVVRLSSVTKLFFIRVVETRGLRLLLGDPDSEF